MGTECSVFLRMEAVNLGNFVYDTNDLNTIRGGGLLLLESVRVAEAALADAARAGRLRSSAALTKGASSAIFAIDCESSEAGPIRSAIEDALREDPALRHATFVVDCIEVPRPDGTYDEIRESLLAANRWRQVGQASLAVPPEETTSKTECAYDLVSPACERYANRPGQPYLSPATAVRVNFGRDRKKSFYEEYAPHAARASAFSSDFTGLTSLDREDALTPGQSRLDGKMALLYVDGNRFGDIQRRFAANEKMQRVFYDTVVTCRQQFLTQLLNAAASDVSWQGGGGRFTRLETLLWGGDEFVFVVPAWKGWWLAAEFFRVSRNWSFRPEAGAPVSLTHAAGLVFCHSNAPIARIQDLARSLASLAKRRSRSEERVQDPLRSQRSYLAYQVMESFDFVSGSLIEFRHRRRPWIAEDETAESSGFHQLPESERGRVEAARERRTAQMILAGEELFEVAERLCREKDARSKKSVFEHVRALQAAPVKGTDGVPSGLTKSAAGKQEGDMAADMYFHLLDLWDYVLREHSLKQGPAASEHVR